VLIQQHINGSNTFNRSWAEYKVGFNDSKGNYWLGNDLLSQLTVNGSYKLRFELQLRNHSWYWAEYSSFNVLSEATNYTLLVSGYSGNAGDAFSHHNNMMFTTYDRDNDLWTHVRPDYRNNCATFYDGGGFWYKGCAYCRVNSVRVFHWEQLYPTRARSLPLQISRMWLTC